MRYIPLRALLFSLVSLPAIGLAQLSINTAGLEQSDPAQNLTVSSSIGQVFYLQTPISGDFVLEGVQQPIRIMPLSIDTADLEQNIVLYPNPATTHISLRLDKWQGPLDYHIYSSTGQSIMNNRLTANNQTIRIDQLSSGAYLITLQSGQQKSLTIRFIKQ